MRRPGTEQAFVHGAVRVSLVVPELGREGLLQGGSLPCLTRVTLTTGEGAQKGGERGEQEEETNMFGVPIRFVSPAPLSLPRAPSHRLLRSRLGSIFSLRLSPLAGHTPSTLPPDHRIRVALPPPSAPGAGGGGHLAVSLVCRRAVFSDAAGLEVEPLGGA